jgi:hypothetical protein
MDNYAVYCMAFYCDGDESSNSVTTVYYLFYTWSGVTGPFYTAASGRPFVPATKYEFGALVD